MVVPGDVFCVVSPSCVGVVTLVVVKDGDTLDNGSAGNVVTCGNGVVGAENNKIQCITMILEFNI